MMKVYGYDSKTRVFTDTKGILAMVRMMIHVGAIPVYSRICGDGFIRFLRQDGSIIHSKDGLALTIQVSPLDSTL
jgi:hypothetical protein